MDKTYRNSLAAIDKRITKSGILNAVLKASKDYDDYKETMNKLFTSFEDITLEKLQGPTQSIPKEEKGEQTDKISKPSEATQNVINVINEFASWHPKNKHRSKANPGEEAGEEAAELEKLFNDLLLKAHSFSGGAYVWVGHITEVKNELLEYFRESSGGEQITHFHVSDNSNAFRTWLDMKKIEWIPNGHFTSIPLSQIVDGLPLPNDIFKIGSQFALYKKAAIESSGIEKAIEKFNQLLSEAEEKAKNSVDNWAHYYDGKINAYTDCKQFLESIK